MKHSRIFTVVALGLLVAAGAQAETYQGVHPRTTGSNKAEVRAQAVAAAHSPDPYATGYGADVPTTIVSTENRSVVHGDAVVAAHSADPYATGYGAGVPSVVVSTVDRATVRAQAVAVAHHPDPFWALWQSKSDDSSRQAALR